MLGAAIGAGVGGLISGVVVMVNHKPCDPDQRCFIDYSNVEAFQTGTIVGLLPGALLGGIIGYGNKSYKWENHPLEITTASVSINYRNVSTPGITLRWSFRELKKVKAFGL